MIFFSLIKMDFIKYVPTRSIKQTITTIFFNHSFHLVFFVRLGQLCRTVPIIGSILGILIEYFIRIIYASDISCKAKIGGGLMLVHGHDIVIGGDVIIGKNCKIFNGTTFGNKDTETTINQQPVIGNNVVIGTGAKILGNITLGDNVRVGANSVVLNDIPDNSTAVGIPAKYFI